MNAELYEYASRDMGSNDDTGDWKIHCTLLINLNKYHYPKVVHKIPPLQWT